VVDVLWKLVAECLSDFFVRLASKTIGSSVTRDIRYGFEIPYDDVWHVMCLAFGWALKTNGCCGEAEVSQPNERKRVGNASFFRNFYERLKRRNVTVCIDAT
jgi:hypothetical protein